MKKKLMRGAAALLVAGATVAVVAIGAVSANADPIPDPPGSTCEYVALVPGTLQDLVNGIPNICIYPAEPPATITPGTTTTIGPTNARGGSCGSIPAPSGSGDARKFLSAAWNPSDHYYTVVINGIETTYLVPTQCVDFAVTSGKPSVALQAGEDDLTSVPLARDAVSVATEGFPFTFTEPELQAIYGAPDSTASPDSADGVYTQSASGPTVGDVQRDTTSTTAEPSLVTAVSGGVATLQPLVVLLPQPTSGTRQFFQSALGSTANTTASWVNDNNEENHVSVLTNAGDGAIIPFSVPSYIAQFNGIAPDTGLSADPDFNLNSLRVGVNPDGTGGTVEASASISDGVASPGPLYGDPAVVPDGAVGSFNHDVYSVVPSVVIEADFVTDPEFPDTPANEAYAAAIKTLVTVTLPTSANITAFGFAQISYSADSTTWIHSAWEN